MEDNYNNREISFDPNVKCDICGKLGAYDFMGDYICSECLIDTEIYLEDVDYEDE